MEKSAFRKIKTLFGSKKEEKEHEGKEKYSFAEHEGETLTESPREEAEMRDKEDLPPYETGSKDKTLTQSSREEATQLLVDDVEKEEALPSEVKLWQEGEVIKDLYEVKEVIGTGGMGVVYIVNHRKWNVPLAVKSPRQEIIQSREGKSRFFREAEAWIDIGKHPDIATAYYVRAIDGIPRIFMEYVDGGSLKDWIEQGKHKDWGDILRIAIEFCNGMTYAHDRGLIHRDINPANVLMTKEGKVKITDFGLIKGAAEFLSSPEVGGVKESWKTMTGVGGVFGTPAYMSPEQWDNPHGVGREGDVYSFGVMLFEMITGKGPFEPSPDIAPQAKVLFYKKMHKEDQPQELKKLREDINPKLEMLVLRCLAKMKENRYQSFEKVKSELEGIYEEVVGTPYLTEVVDAVALKADDLNNKALSFLDLGQEEDAVRYWQEALKVNPHHMEATFNLGYWEWKNAIITDDKYLHRIRELESSYVNNFIYWHLLGLIHIERWNLDEAKKALKKAIELGSKESDVYNAVGTTHLGLEEFEPAKEAFIEAVKFSPDKWQPRFYLALTLFKTGERGACLEELATIFDNPKWKEELKIRDIMDVNKAFKRLTEINLPCFRLIKVLDRDNTQRDSIITSAVFSPDGRYAILSGDKTLRLWDIETGECIRTFKGPTQELNSVTFSSDGGYILSGSNDKTLRLWNVKTGECIKTFEGHTDWVKSVAFSPNSRYALSGSWDRTVRLWNVKTGECIRIFKGHTDQIVSVALSPDGRYALSGSIDKSLRLWNVKTGECVRIFKGHTNYVFSVAFSPDGNYALSGSWDKTVRLWDVGNGECIRIFRGHTSAINSVAFSPDGRYALSGSTGISTGDLPRLWDVKTGRCLILLKNEYEGSVDNIQSICFSPDGRYALYGEDYGRGELWDVKTGRFVKIFEPGPVCQALSVTFSPDGKYAISSSDLFLRLWDVETGECIRSFDNSIFATDIPAAFSPDGQYVISKYGIGCFRLWDVETGEGVRSFEEAAVKSLVFSPDGRYILSGNAENFIRLWDVETGRGIRTFEEHAGSVWSVAFSPDGRYILSGSGDKSLHLWNVKTGECFRTFEGHTESVYSCVFSSNGKYALSGSSDKTLRLWNVKTGECFRVLEGHDSYISSVALAPDGRFALSIGSNSIRLWDVKTGRCIRTFKGDASFSVAFSPDGLYALSGGTLSLWSVKYSTGISIFPRFNFMLCFPMGVLRSAREEKEVKELITQARSLIESSSFSQAYRLLRKAQEYQGFERSLEIMELITLCSKKGRRVGINDGWLRKTVEGPSSWSNSVPFSPDGRFAVSRGGFTNHSSGFTISPSDYGGYYISKNDLSNHAKTLQLWDIKTGECIRTFAGHTYSANSVVFSQDGRYILSGGDASYTVGAASSGSNDLLRLWDVETGKCIKTFVGYHEMGRSVAFSTDGHYALSGGFKIIRLWNIETGKYLRTFVGHSSWIEAVVFSPGGRYALSGSHDKTIRLWDIETGECIRTFRGHTSAVNSVAFSPDGKYTLSGSEDKTIRLWDIETGECIRTFEGHTEEVNSVAFTPDGGYALSGSEDKTIRLWDIETEVCIRTFEGHTSGVTSVAFTSDGRYALSGSRDKTVRLWEFDWELEFDVEGDDQNEDSV